jgi:hypothetical protein
MALIGALDQTVGCHRPSLRFVAINCHFPRVVVVPAGSRRDTRNSESFVIMGNEEESWGEVKRVQ